MNKVYSFTTAIIVAILCFFVVGCAHYDWKPKVTCIPSTSLSGPIRICKSNSLWIDRKCREDMDEDSTDDYGLPYPRGYLVNDPRTGGSIYYIVSIGGCWRAKTRTIFMQAYPKAPKLLEDHERCHADGVLTAKQCAQKYPAVGELW